MVQFKFSVCSTCKTC